LLGDFCEFGRNRRIRRLTYEEGPAVFGGTRRNSRSTNTQLPHTVQPPIGAFFALIDA